MFIGADSGPVLQKELGITWDWDLVFKAVYFLVLYEAFSSLRRVHTSWRASGAGKSVRTGPWMDAMMDAVRCELSQTLEVPEESIRNVEISYERGELKVLPLIPRTSAPPKEVK